jgi:hypothetical protein
MSTPLLTIFPTSTKQGQALAESVAQLGAREGYAVTVAEGASQPDVLKACLGSGVVVFDATIEPNDQHNYDIALYMLKQIPFVLIVSRSYLPTNFLPITDGAFPTYPRSKNNSEILEWLGPRLHELRSRVPRPFWLRGALGMIRLPGMAIKEAGARRRREGSIFISYRGSYEQAVAKLATIIRQDAGKSVRFFITGDLAPPNELMSAQDRWTIMRQVNDWIASSAEVWVFWSPDYLESWWTQAELTVLAGQRLNVRSPVFLHDEQTGKTHRLSGVEQIDIGEENRKALTERLLIARNPDWLSRTDRSRLSLMNLDALSSTLLTDQYRNDLIFSCPRCAARVKGSRSVKPPRNFAELLSFDLRQVIDATGSNLQVIPREAVTSSMKKRKGKVVCRDCQTGLTVHKGPPRYWFYPVRTTFGPPPVDMRTGPGGVILEHRPVYLLD